jgi:hypothetical protein
LIPGFDPAKIDEFIETVDFAELLSSDNAHLIFRGLNIGGDFGSGPGIEDTNGDGKPDRVAPWDECLPDQGFTVGRGWKILRKFLNVP